MRNVIPIDHATRGLQPAVTRNWTFLQRASDQSSHDVALVLTPVTSLPDCADLVGAGGPTLHGAFGLSYLRVFPKIAVGPQPGRRSHSA